MKLRIKTVISAPLISTIMIGCNSSNPVTTTEDTDTQMTNGSTEPTATSRFAPMTMNRQILMRDTTNDLEWVNGPGGCHPMVPGKTSITAFNEAEMHCAARDYASHTDWRVPTITEIQIFTVEMQNAGITPFYQNPACPRLQ